MRELVIIVVGILFFISGYSQNNGNVNMQVVEQQQAHYPKGEQAFFQYVYSHLAYPECVKGKVIDDSVTISFDVLPDSTLTNFVVLKDVECNIGNIIVDILRTMKFAPSIQNGTKVKENMMYNFPVRVRN